MPPPATARQMLNPRAVAGGVLGAAAGVDANSVPGVEASEGTPKARGAGEGVSLPVRLPMRARPPPLSRTVGDCVAAGPASRCGNGIAGSGDALPSTAQRINAARSCSELIMASILADT